MKAEEKEAVKGTVWVWTVVGVVVGGWIGMMIAGSVTGVIGAAVVGFLAYRSSAKNGGNAPAWLWRSKKKQS